MTTRMRWWWLNLCTYVFFANFIESHVLYVYISGAFLNENVYPAGVARPPSVSGWHHIFLYKLLTLYVHKLIQSLNCTLLAWLFLVYFANFLRLYIYFHSFLIGQAPVPKWCMHIEPTSYAHVSLQTEVFVCRSYKIWNKWREEERKEFYVQHFLDFLNPSV